MFIQQISVFLENVPGRLRAVTCILAENNVNMRALTLADTSDFGVLRIIVDHPEEAMNILKKNNFIVKMADVIAIEMDDNPGGLDAVLKVMEDYEINIEYMYAFMSSKPKKAMVIFRVDKLEESVKCLKDGGIKLICSQEKIAALLSDS